MSALHGSLRCGEDWQAVGTLSIPNRPDRSNDRSISAFGGPKALTAISGNDAAASVAFANAATNASKGGK